MAANHACGPTEQRGITWLKLFISGVLLMVPCSGIPAARTMIARQLREIAPKQPQTARQIVLEALRRPLYVVIGVCGIYWALTPLFPHFASPGGANRVHAIAGTVTDGVAFIALAWFATRLVRRVNRRLRQWVAEDIHQSAKILATLPHRGLRLILPALVNRLASLFLIGAVPWVIVQGLDASERIIVSRHPLNGSASLRSRRIYTQANLLKKVVITVVLILTAGSMRMVFDSVRQYGGQHPGLGGYRRTRYWRCCST